MTVATPSEYLGARATRLIDREAILTEIHRAIEDSGHPYVFYITAEGGMGKTRLIREVLALLQPGDQGKPQGKWYSPDVRAMREPIDFYHGSTHSMEGLTRSIRDLLAPEPDYFAVYDLQRRRYERDKFDLAGMLRELSMLRDEVAAAFLNDINRLAETQRLVLAFDTTEKLLYEPEEVQKQLGLEQPGIAILPWLLQEFLPCLKNAVVILAGRPKSERLPRDLKNALDEEFVPRSLQPFSLPDTLTYFDELAENARGEGQTEIAARIEAIPSDTREVIWHYTGGRPIRLALMIDYLVVADRLLPAVKEPVEFARQKTEPELETIRQEIEADLVRLLQETGGRADEGIRVLGFARRGMDAELLARVMDLSPAEAENILKELRGLSFVKVRPDDNRIFLHDEMYDLLQEYVLAALPEARQESVWNAILNYYEEKIPQARAQLMRLQRPSRPVRGGAVTPSIEPRIVETPAPPGDPAALTSASEQLESLITEEVHYRLRSHPSDGFNHYYRYVKEALWTNATSLELQLRNELLEFLEERKGEQDLDGLTSQDITRNGGLRWIDRHLTRAEYDEAIHLAGQLRTECADLMEGGGVLTTAELDSLEGRALVYRGVELARAEELLRSARDKLLAFETEDGFQIWRRDVLLGDTLNNLGYLYRVRGRFRDSIQAYNQALPLWRRAEETEAEQANTLNNVSWAFAELGNFRHGLVLCGDGLELRRQLGPRAPIAFSLNTLGMIQTRADQPELGQESCQEAWGIFRDLEQPRGVGLASIALSEALRRRGQTLLESFHLDHAVRLLREAKVRATEAVDIFSDRVPERSRLVEALNELGCVYRNWAYIRPQYEAPDPERKVLTRNAEEAFRRAIREAGTDFLYRGVDAQVNLAWLYYYVENDEQAYAQVLDALKRIPVDYHILEGQGLPSKAQNLPEIFFWVQLGKAHLLLGQLALRPFQQHRDLRALEQAAGYYTVALAYDELYAADFRDLRRALERIYLQLKTLNVKDEFPTVFRGLDHAQTIYQLKTPTRLEQFIEEYFGPRVHLSGSAL